MSNLGWDCIELIAFGGGNGYGGVMDGLRRAVFGVMLYDVLGAAVVLPVFTAMVVEEGKVRFLSLREGRVGGKVRSAEGLFSAILF